MSSPITHVTGKACPAPVARRHVWGQNLADALKVQGLSVKAFHRRLVDAGVDVTLQAVYQWRSGAAAPTPEKQAVIAQVLGTRPHMLFPASAA